MRKWIVILPHRPLANLLSLSSLLPLVRCSVRPTEVRIVRKSDYTFKLGQKLVIECQVYGSKPAPTVRWFRGSQQLDTRNSGSLQDSLESQAGDHSRGQNYISEFNRDINNNLTKISYLALIPSLSDNQKSLVCSAHNPQMPNLEPLSDSIIMNVQCKSACASCWCYNNQSVDTSELICPLRPNSVAAQLNLQYGTNIKEDLIKLGSDVFMDCAIEANPPINELIWLFNDEPLVANVSNGIIISNQSLVLQRIRVENRGQYQCAARNAIGLSRSNKLSLKPKCK